MSAGALGRRVPPDFDHVEKYPLSAARDTITKPTPVVIGVNWYSAFDRPVKDKTGTWWIPDASKGLGALRGGHCVCLKPRGVQDLPVWRAFYDQGQEGACVGFGTSRAMSLVNRKRYFARWLWDQAKLTDEFPDTVPGDDNGTTVRAALGVLKDRGHVVWARGDASMNASADFAARDALAPRPEEGIAAYRWITSMDDLLQVLGCEGLGYVEVLNSWGESYPHLTRFPLSVIERLWREDGEVGVITDR